MKKPSSSILRVVLLGLVLIVLAAAVIVVLRLGGALGAPAGLAKLPTLPAPTVAGAAATAPAATLPPTETVTPTATPTASPVPLTATPTITVTRSATLTVPTPTAAATETPSAQAETATPVDLVKGPDVIYTGQPGEMKIFWQAAASAAFRVDWHATGKEESGSQSVAEYDSNNHLYAITLTGLSTDTIYEYQVMQDGSAEARASATFRTAPDPSATSLKFISYGDTRTDTEAHNAVAEQVVALIQADPGYQTFNLVTGDLVVRGDEEKYWGKQMFNPDYPAIQAELSRLPFLVARGNHEDTGALFSRYFPMPFVGNYYWSFDYGPVHVALIDQYAGIKADSEQYAWLKQDLESSTKTWKIVVLHAPGWSAGGEHENNKTVQEVLQPLFVQTGVSLVIGGHNHYYARAEVDGITHLTIGTGGAPAYGPEQGYPNVVKTWQGIGFCKFEIEGNTLTGTLVNVKGEVQDTFKINK